MSCYPAVLPPPAALDSSERITAAIIKQKEGKVLFNDTLNTFYYVHRQIIIRLYGKEGTKCFI